MTFDDITKPEIATMLAITRQAVKELELIEGQAAKGCATCVKFATSTNHCVHHKAPVPVEFQPQGCNDWRFDSIPF